MNMNFNIGRNYFSLIMRRGYFKVMHNNGSFGYYKKIGFWKSRIN